MKLKNIIYTAAIAATSLSFHSCADYLDVSGELSQNLNKDQVFSNWTYLKQWYGNLYTNLPDYSETGLGVYSGTKAQVNLWAIISGELVCAHPNVLQYAQNSFAANNTTHNRWATCYKIIRQAMIFLENCPPTIGDPSDRDTGNYQNEESMRRYKADAIYMIAYQYYLLFELYGPVPIVEEVADPEDQNIDYARASVDEMVNYIDSLLAQLIDGDYSDALPTSPKDSRFSDNTGYNYTEMLRPTKAAAMALRARLWVYAASPLYNGGFPEAVALRDKEGKQIFPDEDRNKWNTAKQYVKDLIDYCHAEGMQLYNVEGDPNQSVYYLFQALNDEVIWANPNCHYTSKSSNMEPRTAPYSLGYYSTIGGNVGPYQEMVDLFFTENGLDISEDPEYNEAGFTDYPNPCNENNHVDKHIFNMYVNREPRFYADVTYQGKSWHIQPSSYKDWGAYFAINEKSSYKGDDTHAHSGYLLYKFNNREIGVNSGDKSSWYRPWIYFRLADFFLYYAECCMETDDLSTAIEYVDKIRERAGIPGYKELGKIGLWAGGNGTAADLNNKEAVREAIYRERAIEMFAEGNYYFDTHRWMRAGWTVDENGNQIKDNEDKQLIRRGMDISKVTVIEFKENANKQAKTFSDAYGEGSFYNRVVITRYPWQKAMLFYPVPYNELQKSELIIQNPLW